MGEEVRISHLGLKPAPSSEKADIGSTEKSTDIRHIASSWTRPAIVVEGRYLTVTDMRACNAYASACHAQLRLIGDPHGGYYDEGRVWHPHVKAPAQATYGLGVGATTVSSGPRGKPEPLG